MLRAVLVLTIVVSSCLAKVPLDQFFTFGVANGDSLMVGQTDGSSPAIPLMMNYRLFSYYHSSLYVNVNGGVSFMNYFGIPPSQCSLLPSSGIRTVGVFLGHMHNPVNITYKERVDAPTLQRANNILRQVYPDYTGNVNWTFIATYYNNTGYFPSCHNSSFKPSNTYQLVLSSDGYNSFVFFLYNDINYIATDYESTNCGQNVSQAARAGFDAGDGLYSLMLPGSCTSEMYTINERSNVGVPGLWVYAVGNSTVEPPLNTFEPPESTPEPVLPTERDCACTYKNIWLDISFLIESSSAMTQNGLLEISGTLANVVGELTISQLISQASRAGVTIYADTVSQLSQLATFNDTDPLQAQLLRLSQTNFVNTATPNLLAGMSQAIGIFNGPGNRAYARNVLVLVASSYSQGTANDAVQLANQFKESGGFIIVIAYQQTNQAPIPRVCDLASPGMCFSNRNDSGMLFNNIAHAFSNCFCKRNDFQFLVNAAGMNPLYYGTCIHAINAPATANTAQMICNNEDGALSTIFNNDKLTFLTNISVNVLGTDQSWVGLRYNSTQSPAGWYWLDAAGQYTPWNNMPDWNPGMPNRALGDCVQLKRYQGFTLRLTSAQCSQTATALLSYTCQYNACDTDKFCPEATI